MNRKTFIESHGATCKNWTWSWSFVNTSERFVIFGAWDKNVTDGAELILRDDWQISQGRKSPAYEQSREHIRLVEEDGYQLKTFPMQFSNELQDKDGNGPAKIKGFTPSLSDRRLVKVGDNWFAEPFKNEQIAPPALPSVDENRVEDEWSKEELQASVDAYVDMLNKERSEEPYIKKRYYENLAEKFGRTQKAYEFRMQNISYVLSLIGRNWLSGLKPAKNVGAKNAGIIEEMLGSAFGQQSPPVAEFEMQVSAERGKKKLAMPPGKERPTASTGNITQYNRDASVKAWVLEQSSGICEYCESTAPFHRVDGFPYLEVHHIKQLADGGSDKPENAVALCPNCHREIHYGIKSKQLVETLYERLARLIRE